VLDSQNGMRRSVWTSAFCLALLISGCAKRQSGARLVYIASPPEANSAAPEPDSGTLVIEEPAKPQLEVLPLPEPRPPFPTNDYEQGKRRRPSGPPAPAEPAAEEPPVEPPPLEPADKPGQDRRKQLEKTQQDMDVRIKQFVRSRLSGPERGTLDEARAFLNQSRAALNDGDVPRAEKLADKARLLITALEKGH